MSRDRLVLEHLGQAIKWRTQQPRTIDAVRGLYRTYPGGSRLGAG